MSADKGLTNVPDTIETAHKIILFLTRIHLHQFLHFLRKHLEVVGIEHRPEKGVHINRHVEHDDENHDRHEREESAGSLDGDEKLRQVLGLPCDQ
jgi:hypothetical protein